VRESEDKNPPRKPNNGREHTIDFAPTCVPAVLEQSHRLQFLGHVCYLFQAFWYHFRIALALYGPLTSSTRTSLACQHAYSSSPSPWKTAVVLTPYAPILDNTDSYEDRRRRKGDLHVLASSSSRYNHPAVPRKQVQSSKKIAMKQNILGRQSY